MTPTTRKYLSIPIILMVGMFVFSCQNDLEEINRVTESVDLPVQTIRNARISYSDSGHIQFLIEAAQVDRYPGEEPRDEFSGGFKVTSYNFDGEIESEITAEEATNYPEKHHMIARDSVMLKDKEGKILQTELLTWDEETDRIFTDKFVKITTPTEILYGDGLEANQDFTRYEIKNIKGRIKIEDGEKQNEE
ncbi:MAG: LPS export ABC transporter periplasmic protein LptC [Flavobacteriales bacterium]|jgi:LPS export ABC transporter protein LptC|nr:LPS export ABC transporter periplasmic protein LptC [Flavobacteriales bacterium]NCG28642.1 LPS export ABC transporter periplasmic protein LptC [Verrucomicrobiales bacterium]MBT3963896.1 LPS export ABC transporter periplasmic protein LptC [Flavobacteriales bacterium]MBT4706196.1 LPS export ABC transporter periplasmic protein LptC [Flavobacteriales bacterium]MBT4931381.1 LPS export ABC transporter periplasmic protein LptC [Flavobacteriales bacterium]